MKPLLLAFFLISLAGGLSAQQTPTVLHKHRNLPHVGDSIIKQQVLYVDPGVAGRDVTWDFSVTTPVNDSYNLLYKAITHDSLQIVGIEHRTAYRYRVQGDSLLHTGYENATTLMKYTRPEIRMRFPFHYGDSITSSFIGTGEYCHRIPLHVAGTTTVTADAAGTLHAPSGEIYKNVLRVKTFRQYTETGVDSVTMQLEIYSWYAKGNRYPVFETVKTTTQKTGKADTEHQVASFFFPPVNQTQQTDTTGLAETDSIPSQGGVPIDRIFTRCKLLPNPVQSQLEIDYDLTQNATINFSLHDALGMSKIATSPIQQPAGHYTQLLDMGSYSQGIYPLYVTVNGMVKTLHVVKR
jgi:hypothetical protein